MNQFPNIPSAGVTSPAGFPGVRNLQPVNMSGVATGLPQALSPVTMFSPVGGRTGSVAPPANVAAPVFPTINFPPRPAALPSAYGQSAGARYNYASDLDSDASDIDSEDETDSDTGSDSGSSTFSSNSDFTYPSANGMSYLPANIGAPPLLSAAPSTGFPFNLPSNFGGGTSNAFPQPSTVPFAFPQGQAAAPSFPVNPTTSVFAPAVPKVAPSFPSTFNFTQTSPLPVFPTTQTQAAPQPMFPTTSFQGQAAPQPIFPTTSFPAPQTQAAPQPIFPTTSFPVQGKTQVAPWLPVTFPAPQTQTFPVALPSQAPTQAAPQPVFPTTSFPAAQSQAAPLPMFPISAPDQRGGRTGRTETQALTVFPVTQTQAAPLPVFPVTQTQAAPRFPTSLPVQTQAAPLFSTFFPAAQTQAALPVFPTTSFPAPQSQAAPSPIFPAQTQAAPQAMFPLSLPTQSVVPAVRSPPASLPVLPSIAPLGVSQAATGMRPLSPPSSPTAANRLPLPMLGSTNVIIPTSPISKLPGIGSPPKTASPVMLPTVLSPRSPRSQGSQGSLAAVPVGVPLASPRSPRSQATESSPVVLPPMPAALSPRNQGNQMSPTRILPTVASPVANTSTSGAVSALPLASPRIPSPRSQGTSPVSLPPMPAALSPRNQGSQVSSALPPIVSSGLPRLPSPGRLPVLPAAQSPRNQGNQGTTVVSSPRALPSTVNVGSPVIPFSGTPLVLAPPPVITAIPTSPRAGSATLIATSAVPLPMSPTRTASGLVAPMTLPLSPRNQGNQENQGGLPRPASPVAAPSNATLSAPSSPLATTAFSLVPVPVIRPVQQRQ